MGKGEIGIQFSLHVMQERGIEGWAEIAVAGIFVELFVDRAYVADIARIDATDDFPFGSEKLGCVEVLRNASFIALYCFQRQADEIGKRLIKRFFLIRV